MWRVRVLSRRFSSVCGEVRLHWNVDTMLFYCWASVVVDGPSIKQHCIGLSETAAQKGQSWDKQI